MMLLQFGNMNKELAKYNTKLFAEKVLPTAQPHPFGVGRPLVAGADESGRAGRVAGLHRGARGGVTRAGATPAIRERREEHMKRGFVDLLAAGGFAAVAVFSGLPVRAAEPMTLSSSAYQDGAMLDVKNAGNLKDMPSCPADAGNVSPPLAWTNAPDTAKSFALTIVDPEGGGGAGFIHTVVYGIPASVTGFAEGELSNPSDKFIGGKNAKDMATYFGPCPPATFGMHHYAYILFATDIDPKAPELKPGMTRDELLTVLKGHTKATAGLVLRFKHP